MHRRNQNPLPRNTKKPPPPPAPPPREMTCAKCGTPLRGSDLGNLPCARPGCYTISARLCVPYLKDQELKADAGISADYVAWCLGYGPPPKDEAFSSREYERTQNESGEWRWSEVT